MSTLPSADSPVRRRTSLERQLPLMISAVLVFSIVAFGALAFTELRSTRIDATKTQLRAVLNLTLETAARGVQTRLETTARLANDSVIGTLLDAPDPRTMVNQVRAQVRQRRAAADSTLVDQVVLGRDERRWVLSDSEISTTANVALMSTIASIGKRNAAMSPLFALDSSINVWVVAPIREKDNSVRGFFAERRRVAGFVAVQRSLQRLTGQDISVAFTNLSGDVWTSFAARPIAKRFDVAAVPDTFRIDPDSGGGIIGVKGIIAGTPWVLVLSTTQAAVNAPLMLFLRRVLAIGVLVVVLGIVAARLIGRRVTRPLSSLAGAAQAIALGDYSRRELIGTNDEIAQVAHAFNLMAEGIAESQAARDHRIRECELLTKDLEQRNTELQQAQLEATEARFMAEQAGERASRANDAKTEFLAMMSHELRTPLSAIAGYAEILELGIRGELNDAQRVDVGRIRANQTHLLRIINDILDLSHVESGQLMIDSRPISVGEVISDVEPIVKTLIDEKNLRYRVEASHVDVFADRDRLTQVLVNLVANAVRFTEPNGTVAICASQTDDRVRIEVVDTGIGIPEEKREAIFQPFVQVEGGASRRAQGTGLGLAISRRLVEAMGGTLTLRSTLGVGSTFLVDLPAAHPPSDFDLETSTVGVTLHTELPTSSATSSAPR